jgi:DNA-binding transcriptional MerR regulator
MNHGRVESPSLFIGKVARRAGVGVETIRFYERQGLLTPPIRKDSGYRLYPQHVFGRIRFIRRAQELGFSLREIKELLELRRNSSAPCEDERGTETQSGRLATGITIYLENDGRFEHTLRENCHAHINATLCFTARGRKKGNYFCYFGKINLRPLAFLFFENAESAIPL